MAALPGWVYLVGAGPGDPGLLTVRAQELLQEADVVIHDRLVNPAILASCRRGALLVGRSGKKNRQEEQAEICRLMIDHARQGRSVVRLKGGDPLLFGRGGEEAEALRRAGIPYEIVPGVSAGLGVPAYSGIPLTHRAHAASVAFITGREREDREQPAVRWADLARAADTLVVFMALGQLEEIAARLLAAGRAPSTPAAVISQGTLPGQRAVFGTLADIARRARAAGLKSPAMLVVGAVCALGPELDWFGRRSYRGRHILLPRTVERPGRLAAYLRSTGAEVSEPSLYELARPAEESLAELPHAAGRFRWLVFLTPLAAHAAFAYLAGQGLDSRALAGTHIAATGAATREALARHGIRADLVAARRRGSLVDALAAATSPGTPVLVLGGPFPSGVADALRRRGIPARECPAYRWEPDALARSGLPAPDAVVLASSAVAEAFAAAGGGRLLAGPANGPGRSGFVICIGPETAAAARRAGLPVAAVADPPGAKGVLACLEQLWGRAARLQD